jgi:hypothetical protein
MSWFGKLFGTDEAVRGVLDTGKELLDDAFYTDSEKAEDRAKDASEVRGMLVDWMKNTQGQNLSRRIISLSITATWLSMFIIATLLSVSAVWVADDVSTKLMASSSIIDNRAEAMTGAVMLILGFYFALPKVTEIANAAIDKFGKQGGTQ